MKTEPNIRSIRQSLGWTQGQMADYLSVDQSSVSRMEAGQHLTGPIRKLLEALLADGPIKERA